MRILLPIGVALGVAAGLLSDRFIPTDSIWPGVIIGVAVGAAFFVLIKAITGKGKETT